SDDLMARYYPLLLGRNLKTEEHPLAAKKQLALEIVQAYHSAAVAQATLDDWNTRFSNKKLEDAELPTISQQDDTTVTVVLSAYAGAFGITKSKADANRLIKQGSVQVDGSKILDPAAKISLRPGQVLRLDKTHAVRVK